MPVSLKERYSESLLNKAEERRRRLNHNRIHVGLNNSQDIDRILDLLFQAHQAYYLGFFESSAILCGVLFEQSLFTLLKERAESGETLTHLGRNREILHIRNPEEMKNFNLIKLTAMAMHYHIIPYPLKSLADELRLFRNQLVHAGFPKIHIRNGCYVTELPVNPSDPSGTTISLLELPYEEVEQHCLEKNAEEICTYYLLTRTRRVISQIFQDRVRVYPPEEVSKPDNINTSN